MEKQWQPTPAFLPGESHGQRSLVGNSSWGHQESDMTGRLSAQARETLQFSFLHEVSTVLEMDEDEGKVA